MSKKKGIAIKHVTRRWFFPPANITRQNEGGFVVKDDDNVGHVAYNNDDDFVATVLK